MSNQPDPARTADAIPNPAPGQAARSEGLLPADPSDPNLQVAEEVAFDLQSDQARRIGSMPADTPTSQPAAAVAKALSADDGKQPDPGKA